MDFIFGRATAVFDRCEIRSLDRGSTSNNGYVTAASTSTSNDFGFLFSQCRRPARRWPAPSSWAGPGIRQRPERDRPGGLPGLRRSARHQECTVDGHVRVLLEGRPLRRVPEQRPRLDRHRRPSTVDGRRRDDNTATDYLAGMDGWNPSTEDEPDAGTSSSRRPASRRPSGGRQPSHVEDELPVADVGGHLAVRARARRAAASPRAGCPRRAGSSGASAGRRTPARSRARPARDGGRGELDRHALGPAAGGGSAPAAAR